VYVRYLVAGSSISVLPELLLSASVRDIGMFDRRIPPVCSGCNPSNGGAPDERPSEVAQVGSCPVEELRCQKEQEEESDECRGRIG
jgi:hypothetical protein